MQTYPPASHRPEGADALETPTKAGGGAPPHGDAASPAGDTVSREEHNRVIRELQQRCASSEKELAELRAMCMTLLEKPNQTPTRAAPAEAAPAASADMEARSEVDFDVDLPSVKEDPENDEARSSALVFSTELSASKALQDELSGSLKKLS